MPKTRSECSRGLQNSKTVKMMSLSVRRRPPARWCSTRVAENRPECSRWGVQELHDRSVQDQSDGENGGVQLLRVRGKFLVERQARDGAVRFLVRFSVIGRPPARWCSTRVLLTFVAPSALASRQRRRATAVCARGRGVQAYRHTLRRGRGVLVVRSIIEFNVGCAKLACERT